MRREFVRMFRTGKWKKVLCTALVPALMIPLSVPGRTAEAASGMWKHDSSGWRYEYSDGSLLKNNWVKDNGKWYHLNEDGYMDTGWKKIGGKWFFFWNSGAMHTGWKKYNGKWYYFTANGVMHTGWKKIDGIWYLFSGGGIMWTGWKEIGEKKYYFDPDGAMVTGQVVIEGKTCVFDDDGLFLRYKEAEQKSLADAEVGDYVRFGTYEQDRDSSNGKEPIEWIVLDIRNEEKLLISRYALDSVSYNVSKGEITWENSTIRSWVNSTFPALAFSDEEVAKICKKTVSADKNPRFGTDAGNATKDQVFLLSIDEARKYFADAPDGTSETRAAKPTTYARGMGAWRNTASEDDWYYGNGWWWLRTPGYETSCATFVNYNVNILDGGSRVNRTDVGVRPAIWVKP